MFIKVELDPDGFNQLAGHASCPYGVVEGEPRGARFLVAANVEFSNEPNDKR